MTDGYEITLTRDGADRTYSWKPQSRLSRLLMASSALAMLILLASLAIWLAVLSVAFALAWVAFALIRAPLRRWFNRRRGGSNLRPY